MTAIRLILFLTFLILHTGVYAQASKTELAAVAETDANAVQILIEDSEFENAIARVDVALKKNRKHPRLLLQRGLILVQLGELEKAATHYKSLKKKLKNNPEPANNLAMVYKMAGNYTKSVKEFKSVIKKYPDYAAAYENLGDTYIEMAQKVFEQGSTAHPESQILASKVELGKGFHDIATSNTPFARRQALSRTSSAVGPAKKGHSGAIPISDENTILEVLGQWISHWSDRNIEGFLSHYSSDFTPPDSVPLSQWVETSRQSISQAKYIRIKLDNIGFTAIEADQIKAQFNFHYESDSVTNRSIMALTFKRFPGQWLIVLEESRVTG